MSNDSEVLHNVGAPSSIIMNGERQTHKTLREAIRAIWLKVRYDEPESENLTWIQARETELEEIQDIINKIEKDNEFSTFLSVFRGAKTVVDVKKKDITDGWGFNVNEFQKWTDLHYGEISIDGQASREMTFHINYSRDHYGKWGQTVTYQSEEGQLRHLDNFVSDTGFKDTKSRFKQEGPKCRCHRDHPNPELHPFVPQNQLDARRQFEQEIIN